MVGGGAAPPYHLLFVRYGAENINHISRPISLSALVVVLHPEEIAVSGEVSNERKELFFRPDVVAVFVLFHCFEI